MDRPEVVRLRRELDRQSRRRQRRRYPAGLRREALEYARGRHGQGAETAEIAGELGVKIGTLRGWLRRTKAFRAVEVIERRAPETANASMKASMVVTTPRGLRIEGLDVAGLAELVARIG